jgi:serine/threonine protein phosphatase PrpC
MHQKLSVSIGQYSDRGRKEINQDFHAASIPGEPQLSTKGIALALADGISSSDVSQIASQAAVKGFIEDYYCTSDAWSVRQSAMQVLAATNSWLYAQTRQSQYRFEKDKGYVCTFAAIILKSTMAHLFHAGDSRIYHVRDGRLEVLTEDHRYWISNEQSYLTRALGIDQRIDVEYRALAMEVGDVFILMTDGVFEHVSSAFVVDTVRSLSGDLETAARLMAEEAYTQGSTDNLTVQILRVDSLPLPEAQAISLHLSGHPFPPELDARMEFDGYRILRSLHISHRSHVWLALDTDSQKQVVIKVPSTEHREDPAYLERFLLEEWIARRINNPHVMKPCFTNRKRSYQYIVFEYVDGQTLAQWMLDNPEPGLNAVREIIGQVAKGLQAFHRLEMLHQDLRPENVMIDSAGVVKIIDFGSVHVAGIAEIGQQANAESILGTEQFSAPEYFLGEGGSTRSDLYSLGAMAYQLLSGRLPYDGQVSRARSVAAQHKLVYEPIRNAHRPVPGWVDDAIRKAIQLDPYKRYGELSEFVYDLSHPNSLFLSRSRPPLIERNPAGFWKGVSALLAIALLIALYQLSRLSH